MKKKKLYLRPSAAVYVLYDADGLLTTFSKSHSENASENDNPPMDAKSGSGEWDSLWE